MIHGMCGGVFQAQVVEKLEDFIEEVSNAKIDDSESQLSFIRYSLILDGAYLSYYSIKIIKEEAQALKFPKFWMEEVQNRNIFVAEVGDALFNITTM